MAQGLLGTIHGFQGKLTAARRMLVASLATSEPLGHYHMSIDSTASLAYVAAAEGAHDEAAEHVRKLLERWDGSEDHHFAISGLQWASGFLAGRGDRAGAHGCAEALSRIASTSGHPYALAALARAIGETALLGDDADTAAEQLARAVEIHRGLDVPFERAQIELRAGVALAAAGDREAALERLGGAYRTARKLGARPLASEAATEVARLGGSVSRRVGEDTGLTRRELEVVRLIAVGRTNRDVAQELFLSPRTVDMHVRHILRKLDCHSRVRGRPPRARARAAGLRPSGPSRGRGPRCGRAARRRSAAVAASGRASARRSRGGAARRPPRGSARRRRRPSRACRASR